MIEINFKISFTFNRNEQDFPKYRTYRSSDEVHTYKIVIRIASYIFT